MNSWKIVFATLIIFVAGLVVGGLVVNKTEVANPSTSRPGSPLNGNGGQFRLQSLQLLLHRMDRELALTSEQHDQIQQIISVSQERAGELWKPVAQAVSKETRDACDQIRDVLTPEQQTKFDSLPKGGRGGDFGERGRHRSPGGPTNHFSTNRLPLAQPQ